MIQTFQANSEMDLIYQHMIQKTPKHLTQKIRLSIKKLVIPTMSLVMKKRNTI